MLLLLVNEMRLYVGLKVRLGRWLANGTGVVGSRGVQKALLGTTVGTRLPLCWSDQEEKLTRFAVVPQTKHYLLKLVEFGVPYWRA
jgi:hypothetical protein